MISLSKKIGQIESIDRIKGIFHILQIPKIKVGGGGEEHILMVKETATWIMIYHLQSSQRLYTFFVHKKYFLHSVLGPDTFAENRWY